MTYRQIQHVVKRRIAEELFLIPVKNNLADMRHVFVLHGCGEFVWDRLDGRQSEEDISRALVAAHEGRSEDAITMLGDAIVALDESETRFVLVRARLDRAALLRRVGRAEEAMAERANARALAEECGFSFDALAVATLSG